MKKHKKKEEWTAIGIIFKVAVWFCVGVAIYWLLLILWVKGNV